MRYALLFLMAGCSLVFTNSPKPETTCNTSEASPIADGVFMLGYALATVELIKESTDQYSGDDEIPAAILTAGLGALFGASAYYGVNNIDKCRRHNKELYDQQVAESSRPVRAQVPVPRKDAWQLTKHAAIAARNNDCATVIAIDEVVSTLDPEFYRTVFMRDVGIVRCMTSSELPQAAPGATAPTAPAPAPVAPAPAPVTP